VDPKEVAATAYDGDGGSSTYVDYDEIMRRRERIEEAGRENRLRMDHLRSIFGVAHSLGNVKVLVEMVCGYCERALVEYRIDLAFRPYIGDQCLNGFRGSGDCLLETHHAPHPDSMSGTHTFFTDLRLTSAAESRPVSPGLQPFVKVSPGVQPFVKVTMMCWIEGTEWCESHHVWYSFLREGLDSKTELRFSPGLFLDELQFFADSEPHQADGGRFTVRLPVLVALFGISVPKNRHAHAH
jgi:hypothetical protein